MAEVKRAYRKLAKAFHPDSAGQAALPRFLAIHEAYEQLNTGRVLPASRAPAPADSTSAEPWRADPERARAARERARRRTGGPSRAGRTGTSGPSFDTGRKRPTGSTGSGAPGGSGGSGGSAGSSRSAGSGGPNASGGSGAREKGRRNVRKATMGSTSYDEARDPADATWSGASWYGPSSGEYWIVNPREYADPRKHGPGYQQRARHASAAGGAIEADTEPSPAFEATSADATTPDPTTARQNRPFAAASGATEDAWRGSSEAARDGRQWSPPPRPGWAGGVRADGEAARPLPGDQSRGFDPLALGGASRDWLGNPGDDPIRRLGLALVAWPPIGLAAAVAIGEVTGCAAYSAACSGSDALLPWLAQAAILGLLLLLPPLARLFVGGTLAVIMALVPVTAFLVVVGAGGAPQAAFVLGLFLALAWLTGVAWTAFRRGPARAAA
jgi:hypothetical protein